MLALLGRLILDECIMIEQMRGLEHCLPMGGRGYCSRVLERMQMSRCGRVISPGRFRLNECAHVGHGPRLSPAENWLQ